MDLIQIISLTASVLHRLLPITLELIISQAKGQGLQIGHTEAELVRSAVYFAQTKKERHPEAKLQPVFFAKD